MWRGSSQDLPPLVRAIAVDRWNATQLAGQLEADGFEMVAFGQGYASMNAPTMRLEQLALGGNPVLRWMSAKRAGRDEAMVALGAAVRPTDVVSRLRSIKPTRAIVTQFCAGSLPKNGG